MDITGFLPSFGGVLFTIIAFIVALSVIVAIHEFGHYIVGRWSGIKADVFSIGFGPVLWARPDRHGTRWQIAALPFGGYVKFKGDSDAASSGKDGEAIRELTAEELRQTMHGAPLWARAATVAAGPVFNFVLSFILFTGIALSAGVISDPLTIKQLHPLPSAVQELEPGDSILAIGGIDMEDPELARKLDALPGGPVRSYTVLRDGDTLQVDGPPLYPARAGGVDPTAAAHAAGMQEGDVILSVDGTEIHRFNDMIEPINATDGAPLELAIWRDGDTQELTITPIRRDLPSRDGGFETRWLIGVSSAYFFEPQIETPGVLAAMNQGVNRVTGLVTLTFSGLYHMVTGSISSCGVSGPIGIAQMSGTAASQGIVTFVMFIGLLSTAVGLLNLFPVPILDGGHLVFFAYEAVAGRPPSDRALKIMMSTGLALLLALMVFAVTNDLFCP